MAAPGGGGSYSFVLFSSSRHKLEKGADDESFWGLDGVDSHLRLSVLLGNWSRSNMLWQLLVRERLV